MPCGPLFKTCCGKVQSSHAHPRQSGILQPSLPATKIRQPLEASHGLMSHSSLNKFLVIPKFKMENSESICASLKKGEWVTSIDLTDAYLHVTIHTQYQKYLSFYFKEVTYQFTSLPFGLAMTPLICTSIVKEVKLMALQSGISLHHYLDDWLLRTGVQGTDTKVTKASEGFGLYSKPQEVRSLSHTEVRLPRIPIFTRFGSCEAHARQVDKTRQEMFHRLSTKSVISARTLMSTIGFPASMEKTVKLGRMHLRPFQWRCKTHKMVVRP